MLFFRKIKFKFFTSFGNNLINDFHQDTVFAKQLSALDKTCHENYEELKELVDKIDLNNWVGHNKITMESYLRSKNYTFGTGWHPKIDGQTTWANMLKEEIF